MDILSRLEKETAEDEDAAAADEDADDLSERLQDLDLERDTDKIWSRLTDKVGYMMMLMIYMKGYKTLILRQIQTKYGQGLLIR